MHTLKSVIRQWFGGAPSAELIVNADDFGMNAAVNRGIIAAHEDGIVTSASLMVARDGLAEAAAYARTHPRLGIGLHLDLGEWVRRNERWVPNYVVVPLDDSAAVEREVDRQLMLFHSALGTSPTHIDSHQHVHQRAAVYGPVARAAEKLRIPLRHHSTVQYCGRFYAQGPLGEPNDAAVTPAALISLLQQLSTGMTELCCHPSAAALPDDQYGEARVRELATLCDPAVKATARSRAIRLRSFRGITGTRSGAATPTSAAAG